MLPILSPGYRPVAERMGIPLASRGIAYASIVLRGEGGRQRGRTGMFIVLFYCFSACLFFCYVFIISAILPFSVSPFLRSFYVSVFLRYGLQQGVQISWGPLNGKGR